MRRASTIFCFLQTLQPSGELSALCYCQTFHIVTDPEQLLPLFCTTAPQFSYRNSTEVPPTPALPLYFHHEGFFWRCWFNGEDFQETIWNFWFTSQAHPKHCIQGYLFPMPIAPGPVPHPSYDPTAVYRGFWTAFIILAVAASVVGGLLLVCAVPFAAARLYRVGGGFLITAGVLLALLIALFALWKEFAADLKKYILLERSHSCPPDAHLHVYYGWSFMFAAAGAPLVLLSGLLFHCISRSLHVEEK
ncbi:transmembrane protein 182-like isoform X1 [Hyla sarda]|uniref:transmembrane protein 182-like isoform X1 n=1 Tax=Hyla sarda TaxID=327740 RepID=UPI0024C27032|nr:transmembrane protein 182-like isoform X1 [Hyla sarda]